jgi:hypothetical protein
MEMLPEFQVVPEALSLVGLRSRLKKCCFKLVSVKRVARVGYQ